MLLPCSTLHLHCCCCSIVTRDKGGITQQWQKFLHLRQFRGERNSMLIICYTHCHNCLAYLVGCAMGKLGKAYRDVLTALDFLFPLWLIPSVFPSWHSSTHAKKRNEMWKWKCDAKLFREEMWKGNLYCVCSAVAAALHSTLHLDDKHGFCFAREQNALFFTW